MKRCLFLVMVVFWVAIMTLTGCGGDGDDHGDGDIPIVATTPTITSFTPSSGIVGTQVIISGSNFSTTASNNSVMFNGTTAIVISSTNSQIITTVPTGAASGAITITVAGKTATSGTNFVVTSAILMGGSFQGQTLTLVPTVTTFAGSGTVGSANGTGILAQFNDPNGITTDGTNLYVADSNNKTIRKIVISTGEVTTIAGTSGVSGSTDGPGISTALFAWPSGITTDGTNLYISDTGKVRQMVIATGMVSTIASGSSLGGTPYGITTDGTNVYVACRGNGVVQIAIATGVATTIPSTTAFNFPHGITTDGTNLYMTEDNTYTLKQVVIATGILSTIAGSGTNSSIDGTGITASFGFPAGITSDGTFLYVADESGSIRKVEISTNIVTTIATGFNVPGYLTTDGTSLYVTDRVNHIVKKIN